MSPLRRTLNIALLSAAFTLSVHAGQMDTGYAPPPPTTNAAGQMDTGYAGQMDTGYAGEMGTGAAQTSSASSITEILLLIIQGLAPRI